MAKETYEYIPGVCNIGPGEVRKRRTAALAAILLLLVCIAVVFGFKMPQVVRLSLFLPATAVGLTVQQWYKRFCYGFAMQGIFDGKKGDQKFKVADEFLQADRKRAKNMLWISLLVGAVLTVAAYFMPF